ncbi:YD repeat-containing protein, partial [Epilithonimonas hungarica]
QTLMTRQDLGTEKLDTYYVYNQYGQLVMIVPPKASAQTLTQDVKEQLCYTYRYDARGRLIEKRLPGKGREEMVYDRADRLILYRDANMRGQNRWLITKYDLFGRVLYTGFLSGGDRGGWQTIIMDGLVIEQPDGTGFARNGMQVLYSNGWFHELDTVLSVNYYDTYPVGTPAKPALIAEAALSSDILAAQSTKTMPTASYVKNIYDDKWTRTWYWYDQRGRSTGAQESNHLGGTTVTHTEQDWAGITQKVETEHQRTANATKIKVRERFVYNERNYLEKHYHQVDANPEELLASYTYNELGQVTNKQVGNNLQGIDYAYNVRGWLTNINDVTAMGSKLFAYKVNYAQRDGLETPNLDLSAYKVQPRYNGNIAETVWQAVYTVGDVLPGTPQRQGYVYDGANRLKAGFYQLPESPASKANSEIIEEYDPNGNIVRLKRTGSRQKGQVKMIDNLTYDLQGNRITSVTDAANNLNGYGGGGGAMVYDANGNMTAMPDKGITNISYNFLNLPEEIAQTNVSTFYYRADGVKLRKRLMVNNEAGSNPIITDYLDGFVYTTPMAEALQRSLELEDAATMDIRHARQEETFTEATDRGEAAQPGDPGSSGMELSYFPTAEGYYDYQNNRYIYQYKDHLGNVRLSYARNPDTGSIDVLDRNDYYPFGMNMQGVDSSFDTMGSFLN